MLSSVLLFLDISGGEFMLIMLVALLVLGPQKLGDAARKAGKMMNEVKRVSGEFTEQLKQETSGLTEEVQGIRDSIRDTATDLKDQLLKEKEEAEKSFAEAHTGQPIEEPAVAETPEQPKETITDIHQSDIYHISASEPYKGFNNECHPYELEIQQVKEVESGHSEISQSIPDEADLNQKNTTQTKDQQ